MLRIRALMASGRGDDDEADELRERTLDTWHSLTPTELRFLQDASADLHALQGSERNPTSHSVDANALRSLGVAVEEQKWPSVLELLRYKVPQIREDYQLYFRARAYRALGFPELSVPFIRAAASVSPSNINFEALLLDTLLSLGSFNEAVERAEEIVRDPNARHPRLRLRAADVFFRAAQHETNSGRRGALFTRVTELIERSIEGHSKLPDNERLRSVEAGAWIELGLAYSHLADHGMATSAFERGLERFGDHSLVCTAAGLHYLRLGDARGDLLLRRAAQLQAQVPYPYMYLAHSALKEGDRAAFDGAVKVARERTTSASTGATLDAWIAAMNEEARDAKVASLRFPEVSDEELIPTIDLAA